MENKTKEIMDVGLGVDADEAIRQQMQKVDKEHHSGNCRNSFPVANVSIPNSVVISCPLLRNALIVARECKSCEHFKGVVQIGWSDKVVLPWSAKYAIYCGRPTERKCADIVTTAC